MKIVRVILLLLCAQSVALADLKITTTTGGGQTRTTYIKGKRQRTEMQNPAFTMTTIQQCDLRRTVQLNDKTRKYIITSLDDAGQPDTSAAAGVPQEPQTARRGAVVQITQTVTDTGERRQMFGYTARHIKSKMVMDAPPEACNPGHSESEMDAWYIDLNVAFSCDAEQPAAPPARPARPGCQDHYRTKVIGTAKLGYPVKMGDYSEVTDISTITLDQSLFDIPEGYTQTANMMELMGMGGMSGMAGMTGEGGQPPEAMPPTSSASPPPAAAALGPKRPGTIRIGVAAINNRAGGEVSSLDDLRAHLVGQISGDGVEAVPLDALQQTAAETEARQKDCDLLLMTDLSALKQSAAGRIGGMFGRAAGVPTGGAEKFESRVDFHLYAVGGASQLESNATAKEDGAQASVSTALDKEAKAVAAAARKKH